MVTLRDDNRYVDVLYSYDVPVLMITGSGTVYRFDSVIVRHNGVATMKHMYDFLYQEGRRDMVGYSSALNGIQVINGVRDANDVFKAVTGVLVISIDDDNKTGKRHRITTMVTDGNLNAVADRLTANEEKRTALAEARRIEKERSEREKARIEAMSVANAIRSVKSAMHTAGINVTSTEFDGDVISCVSDDGDKYRMKVDRSDVNDTRYGLSVSFGSVTISMWNDDMTVPELMDALGTVGIMRELDASGDWNQYDSLYPMFSDAGDAAEDGTQELDEANGSIVDSTDGSSSHIDDATYDGLFLPGDYSDTVA